MANSIDLKTLITNEANAQGVPPAMALAVAQTESGISQWTPAGKIVTSSAGAQGVFQLMPSSFPGQDLTDVNTNISLGISYLKQLYTQYGNWNQALAAYNWGPTNVNNNSSIPSSVASYVSKILGLNTVFSGGTSSSGASAPTITADSLLGELDTSNTTWWALGTLAAVVLIGWALDW